MYLHYNKIVVIILKDQVVNGQYYQYVDSESTSSKFSLFNAIWLCPRLGTMKIEPAVI